MIIVIEFRIQFVTKRALKKSIKGHLVLIQNLF